MWPNPQEIADLVTVTEEILNGKHHFSYSVRWETIYISINKVKPLFFENWPGFQNLSGLNLYRQTTV